MPVSSAAADSLKLASGRTSVNLGGSRTGPVKWLLALNACPAKMAGEPFLRSDNRDMVEFLGGRGRYFSYADAVEKAGLLRGSLRGNSHQAHAAEAVLGALAVYEQAGVALALRLEGTSGCLGTLDAWHEAMVEASAELEAAEREKRHPSLDRLYRANRYFQFLQALVQVEEADPNVALRVIPHEGSYLTPAAALLEKNLSPAGRTALKAYAAACDAYAAGDESTAAETLRQLSGELESILPMDSFKLHFEHCINALEPFFGGFLLYDMSLVCFVVSLFLKRRKALLHFATVFLCMAVLWHLFGIAGPHVHSIAPPGYQFVFLSRLCGRGSLIIRRDALYSPPSASCCRGRLRFRPSLTAGSHEFALQRRYHGHDACRSQFEFLAHHARNDHHDRLRKCFFCRVFSLISSGGPFLRLRTG